MKALTLTQPWAQLVAGGRKRVETRSWKTEYRGPIAIHAAMGYPRAAQEFTRQMLRDGLLRSNRLEFGSILATAVLHSCVPTRGVELEQIQSPWLIAGEHLVIPPSEVRLGDYRPGRWAWLLLAITPLERPIPATGKLGLWEWNGH